jgi:protocatechuate 3,4-dioxygenase beta subunit
MTYLNHIVFISVFACSAVFAQDINPAKSQLLASCEGCEEIFEYRNRVLTSVNTLPDFDDQGIKIKVTGTIYRNDGVTPASDVILYVYHTDQNGIYMTRGDERGWAKRQNILEVVILHYYLLQKKATFGPVNGILF